MKKYDLIILGGGSAGFAAAIEASNLSKKTALVEKGLLGGTCVNVGCVPSKYLLHVSQEYYLLKNKLLPEVHCENVFTDFSNVIERKNLLVESLRKTKYIEVLENLPGVTYIKGEAEFASKNTVKVHGEILKADKILISTGSTPNTPGFKGLDKIKYLTSVEALDLRHLPDSIIIIGGRALALEFAQIFSHLGSNVTILQRSERLLPSDEPEISSAVEKYLTEEGVVIQTGVKILEVSEKQGLKRVECSVKEERKVFEAEQLLMATGRRPNTESLKLGKAGVETVNGFIKINEYLQTTNPNIYAAGDCATPIMLETLAAKMGYTAIRNAFENANLSIDYKQAPSVVFTNPQVARVGYTEKEYVEKTGRCACRVIPISILPKAHIIGDLRGLIKMVIDPQTTQIVGVHIISPLAAEMIHEATLAVKNKLTISDLTDTVHVFPTFTEAVKLAAQSFTRDVSKLSCCVE